MNEKKNIYLIKNIGVLTIGQFGTKIINFFMVPLYTNLLSVSEYGTYDLIYNTIGLLMPILTLSIAEATLRFSITDDTNKKTIFSTSFLYAVRSFFFLVIIILINHVCGLVKTVDDYWYYLLLMYMVQVLVNVLSAFVRGIDKVYILSVSGVICSVFIIIFNLFFLLVLDWGLEGYFLASILGPLVQIVYMIFKLRLWNFLDIRHRDREIEIQMTTYSKPHIANAIGWWINSVSDRYIVTFFLGVAENGIYSIAYKIPTILVMIQNIFSQAWTLSAVKDFDEQDKTGFFSNTYSIYNISMTLLCSGLVLLTKPMALFLYAKDFYVAWKYTPFLLISTVFGALSGYMGGVFAAKKDSKIYAQSTIIGAIVNIVLNVILVYVCGTIGAALATMVSYIVVWYMRFVHVKRYINLRINLRRDLLSYILLLLQAVSIIYFEKYIILEYGMAILFFVLIIFLYYKEIMLGLHKGTKRIKKG